MQGAGSQRESAQALHQLPRLRHRQLGALHRRRGGLQRRVGGLAAGAHLLLEGRLLCGGCGPHQSPFSEVVVQRCSGTGDGEALGGQLWQDVGRLAAAQQVPGRLARALLLPGRRRGFAGGGFPRGGRRRGRRLPARGRGALAGSRCRRCRRRGGFWQARGRRRGGRARLGAHRLLHAAQHPRPQLCLQQSRVRSVHAAAAPRVREPWEEALLLAGVSRGLAPLPRVLVLLDDRQKLLLEG